MSLSVCLLRFPCCFPPFLMLRRALRLCYTASYTAVTVLATTLTHSKFEDSVLLEQFCMFQLLNNKYFI